MLHHAATRRRLARAKADLIDAVAFGYAGCKSKEGANATERLCAALRHD